MYTTSIQVHSFSGAARELPKYDVSIILNLHDEARYLKRTLLSLEEAVRYAQQFDITFEIVVVLDTPDQATRDWVDGYDFGVFDGCQVIEVRNGSLGPSRNDGIEASRGEYIATADADDLVGFDYFYRMYNTAVFAGGRSIVFPEYYFGFGAECYVWKFLGRQQIGNATFYERHPYVSRVVFHRDLFMAVQFADVSLKSGYAYEDWHFNCECLAAGYSVEIARDAVLFYRQRAGSLLRQADAMTSRLIPASRFFEPETYLKLTWAELAGPELGRVPEKPVALAEFAMLPGTADIVAAANRIDPAISLGILKHGHAGSNWADVGPLPRAYFALCSLLAGEQFTDVVLLPFLTKGGAEKYILGIFDGIRRHTPDSRLLVLSGQHFEQHDWLNKLPEDSLFIDLHGLGVPGLSQRDVGNITFRLIQNLHGVKRIHVKTSEYGDAFLKEYSSNFEHIPIFFYYFCEEAFIENGLQFTNGYAFNLISEYGANFPRLISDHVAILDFLRNVIGEDVLKKAHTIYAECALPAKADRKRSKPTRKLLWASRIDEQKRPELLARIAQLLQKEGLEVGLDAYGSTTYGKVGPEVFAGSPLLAYKGTFDGFDALPVSDYDGFLYTAAFDGLPNVLLEALACELPVIAPDVGGIAEAVTSETGFLVENDPDPEQLVERFVEAIKELYANWPEAVRRGANGRKLVAERHSRKAFLDRVAEVFELTKDFGSRPAVTTRPDVASGVSLGANPLGVPVQASERPEDRHGELAAPKGHALYGKASLERSTGELA